MAVQYDENVVNLEPDYERINQEQKQLSVDGSEVDVMAISPLTNKELYSIHNRSVVNKRLDDIKTASVSPGANMVNIWEDFLSILGISVDLDKCSLSEVNKIVEIRTSLLPKLQETYYVMLLGRDINGLLVGKDTINSFSVESVYDKARNFYSLGVINDEQMSRIHYCTGMLYSKYELNKGYNADKDKAIYYVDKYAIKALSLTSDIKMIRTCINDISKKSLDKKNEITIEALGRVLKKPASRDAVTKFQVYSLYGECYQEKAMKANVGYGLVAKDYVYAAAYYRAALRYCFTKDDVKKTLRNLSKVQGKYDEKECIATRVKLLSYLDGKDKVLEALKISSSKGISFRDVQKVLEAATNELIDSDVLVDERMLLWKNIKTKLMLSYGTDKRKLDNLMKIERKYFSCRSKNSRNVVSVKSSKGNNHFGR